MEARFAVQLRIQNHRDKPIDYDGIALDLDLRGMSFASGVSDQSGTIPRFGETVITVPVTVPATAILRHVFQMATNDLRSTRPRSTTSCRACLGGARARSWNSFDSTGEMTLPPAEPTERHCPVQ